MRSDERDPRRCFPVRLTELDRDVRLRAAREACKRENDADERQALLLAALYPSDTVYWIRRIAA